MTGVSEVIGSGYFPTTKLGKKWWKKKLFFLVFSQKNAIA
jgi:hypothetical protein